MFAQLLPLGALLLPATRVSMVSFFRTGAFTDLSELSVAAGAVTSYRLQQNGIMEPFC